MLLPYKKATERTDCSLFLLPLSFSVSTVHPFCSTNQHISSVLQNKLLPIPTIANKSQLDL
jgi:hypothetical protein